jgi:hypothetical protein
MISKDLRLATNFVFESASTAHKLVLGKRITPYIGLIGHNNLGDDVLFQAHKTLFPKLYLLPYRRGTQHIERISRPLGRTFEKVAILGGGTLINDGDDWLGRAEKLQSQGKILFSFGTGAESSAFYSEKDENNILLARWVNVLKDFAFVGVRGPQSKVILEKAGAKNVEVIGDTALALSPDTLPNRKSTNTIGVNYGDVSSNPMWGDRQSYRDELIKVIRTFLDAGSKVVLLPIWDMDIPSNKLLIKTINHPRCTMVEAFSDFKAYSTALRNCDLFIGQKLHSTIIALMNRIPSIMVEYRPKCRDFMKSLDLEDYVIRTSEFTHKTFMTLHSKLIHNMQYVESHAESRILEYKHLQFARANQLMTQLG